MVRFRNRFYYCSGSPRTADVGEMPRTGFLRRWLSRPLSALREWHAQKARFRDLVGLPYVASVSPEHPAVIAFHGGSDDDVRYFAGALELHGAGQVVDRKWAATAVLFDPRFLDHIYTCLAKATSKAERLEAWDKLAKCAVEFCERRPCTLEGEFFAKRQGLADPHVESIVLEPVQPMAQAA